MRVTQRMMTDRVMRNLHSITSRLLEIQDQLSSGKTLRRPSDDPVRFNRVLNLRTSLNKLEQYYANVAGAVDWLNLMDSSLGQTVDVLQKVRTFAIAGANGTLTPEDQSVIAEAVEEALKELLQIANTHSGDKYLFSGTQTLTPPFAITGGTVKYWGDGASMVRAIDEKTVMEISFPGDQIFFRGFEVWSTNPITLNNGDSFSINGVTITIDGSIGSVQDLVNRINNDVTLKQSVYAYFDGSRLFLRSRSDASFTLSDVSGTPLQDWGILDAGGVIINSREAGGVFRVVQELIADLRSGNQEKISGEDIANLDAVIDQVLKIRSQAGAKTNRLENALSRFDDFKLSFKELLSKNEDIDLAEVVMYLQEQKSVYETALAAAAQVIQPTLLQFLR
ncbi:MAG: flagellar hook-associated protein FlgL [Atribacterota bacterium]